MYNKIGLEVENNSFKGMLDILVDILNKKLDM